MFEDTTYFDVVAFGANDPLKIVRFLGQAGISLRDLSFSDIGKLSEKCVRMLALMHFAKANNYDLDTLPEYIQRVTGKDVKEVSFSDYLRFENTKAKKRDVIPSGCEDVVNIVTGKVKLSEAKLSKDEVSDLRKVLALIRQPNAKPETVMLKGKSLTLELLADGGVRARLNAGGGKLYRFSQNALDLSRAVDDVIVANARDYSRNVVLSVLPPLPNPAQGDRIRKLMLANSYELKFVFDDIGSFVQHLDESIRDKAAEILAKLKDIPADSLKPDAQGNVAADTLQKLAEAEALVDALVKSYADSMQAKVTALFAVNDEADAGKALQYQTFAEISGISALNSRTPEGRIRRRRIRIETSSPGSPA